MEMRNIKQEAKWGNKELEVQEKGETWVVRKTKAILTWRELCGNARENITITLEREKNVKQSEKRKDKKQKEREYTIFWEGWVRFFCSLSFSFFVLRRGQKHVLYFCFCTEKFFSGRLREREKETKKLKTKMNMKEKKTHWNISSNFTSLGRSFKRGNTNRNS